MGNFTAHTSNELIFFFCNRAIQTSQGRRPLVRVEFYLKLEWFDFRLARPVPRSGPRPNLEARAPIIRVSLLLTS